MPIMRLCAFNVWAAARVLAFLAGAVHFSAAAASADQHEHVASDPAVQAVIDEHNDGINSSNDNHLDSFWNRYLAEPYERRVHRNIDCGAGGAIEVKRVGKPVCFHRGQGICKEQFRFGIVFDNDDYYLQAWDKKHPLHTIYSNFKGAEYLCIGEEPGNNSFLKILFEDGACTAWLVCPDVGNPDKLPRLKIRARDDYDEDDPKYKKPRNDQKHLVWAADKNDGDNDKVWTPDVKKKKKNKDKKKEKKWNKKKNDKKIWIPNGGGGKEPGWQEPMETWTPDDGGKQEPGWQEPMKTWTPGGRDLYEFLDTIIKFRRGADDDDTLWQIYHDGQTHKNHGCKWVLQKQQTQAPTTSPVPSNPPTTAPPTPPPTPAPTTSREPSSSPSSTPSDEPSVSPSDVPSSQPSSSPSSTPSDEPSVSPSDVPSGQPSSSPSSTPSDEPSVSPSNVPSSQPSASPSDNPSQSPTSCMTNRWNLNNVITDEPPYIEGETYNSTVYTTDVSSGQNGGEISYGGVLWKESNVNVRAPGMKVVTDGDGMTRDSSCIMTSGVNPIDNSTKQCNDPSMTSKRAKVFTDDLNGPVDLVFNSCEEDVVDNAYRFFLKYENLSNERITSFKLELGTDIGDDFTKSTDSDGLSFARRDGTTANSTLEYKSIDLATFFSFGLFGNASTNDNHVNDGYYDPENRAIFSMSVTDEDEIVAESVSDNFASLYNGTMQSWIPKDIAPLGYFYDNDNDAETNPVLVADFDGSGQGWQNYRLCDDPIVGNLTSNGLLALNECRSDASDEPVAISANTLDLWGASPLFSEDKIEDISNVNVNTHIKIDDIFASSVSKFTIRITPTEDDDPPEPAAPWLGSLSPS